MPARSRVDRQDDARACARRRYGTVWNPEYGRVYTEIGRDRGARRGRAEEFTHIARIHCWYEDFLAGRATRVAVLATPTRSRPPSSTRCTSAAGTRVRGARRAALRPLPRLRARRAVATRRDARVRGAATLDARALRRARARERSPWLLLKGRSKSGSSARPKRSTALLGCPCSPEAVRPSPRATSQSLARSRHASVAMSGNGSIELPAGVGWGAPRSDRANSAMRGQRPIGCQTS